MPYDPARLRIANLGAEGFRIEWPTPAGVDRLHLFDTLADATADSKCSAATRRQCFIGRGAPAHSSTCCSRATARPTADERVSPN